MSLKYCPKCGNKLDPDASFCDSCGANLEKRIEATEAKSPDSTQTVQDTQIQQKTVRYADSLKRVIAAIFDGILILLIGSAFNWLVINPWIAVNILDPLVFLTFTFPFDWLIGFLYHWLMETYNNGQTLGKMALYLRTVDEKTLGQASSGSYALNNIFKGSPFLLLDIFIGMLKNSGDPKKRLRIMQNASETVVIFIR
ncbi:MAG: RDD family protein [Candidatus Thorarchaeota archaeon]